jgi:hypothetical protein
MAPENQSAAPHRRRSSTNIIYALLICLMLFGTLAWFKNPVYEKGAWAIVGAVIAAFSGALGFKWGVSQPGQPE